MPTQEETPSEASSAQRKRSLVILKYGLFFLGCLVNLSFLLSSGGIGLTLAAGALCLLPLFLARRQGESRGAKLQALMGKVGTALLYLLFLYIAAAWTYLLGWAVPSWGVLASLAAMALWLGSKFWRPRLIPVLLPVGLWSILCLLSWDLGEIQLLCDDQARALSQSDFSLLLPVTRAQEQCQPGEKLAIGRYPRITSALPGKRMLLTSQTGKANSEKHDSPHPQHSIYGSICILDLEDSQLSCIAKGKAQGSAYSEELGQLFVVAWNSPLSDVPEADSALFSIPLQPPYQPSWIFGDGSPNAELFYSPAGDYIALFNDDMDLLRRVRASDGQAQEPYPYPSVPGEIHYDQALEQGVLCGGVAGLATWVKGQPLELEILQPFLGSFLGSISLSWACAWDPEAGKIYSTLPNLGLAAQLDAKSGKAERLWPVGLGARGVVLDGERQLIYVLNFIRGDLRAYDLKTLKARGHWFVGRFARHIRLDKELDGLVVGSTLGLGLIKRASAPNRAQQAYGDAH